MGISSSRRKKNNLAVPPYSPPGGASPGINRPGVGTGLPAGGDLQRQLTVANQTIQNLNNQLNNMRGGGMAGQNMPYGGYGYPGGSGAPLQYGIPPMFGQSNSYGPTGPPLQNLSGLGGNFYQPAQGPATAVYRDTDFAALASIAGLSSSDIALLHREYLNLTRGGSTKMDRVIFRQLLRDVLFELNNENVDRAIESIFTSIDRNRDGFIDFPEFVGAFKDVLKGSISDSQFYHQDQDYSELLAGQIRATGVGSGVSPQGIQHVQQAQPVTQVVQSGGFSMVPLSSMAIQQNPVMMNTAATVPLIDANPPFLTLDPGQASYVIATPGQYLITQPTALQCVPLPLSGN